MNLLRKKSYIQSGNLYAYSITRNKLVTLQIQKRVDDLLKDKFGLSQETINLLKTTRMLDDKVGLSAIQLTQFFFELEKEFGIRFTKEDVMSHQFDNYDELIQIIELGVSRGEML